MSAAASPHPSPESAADPCVAVGRVVGSWGVRGWVKIEPYGSATDSVLLHARRWLVGNTPAGPRAQGLPGPKWVELERVRRHGNTLVAKWRDCADRDAALAFKAAEVRVLRADFPVLPADEFYWVDLVGCAVQNQAGEALGVVAAVRDHGAHAILETDQAVLIPFVEPYLVQVDLTARLIVVDWQRDWSQ